MSYFQARKESARLRKCSKESTPDSIKIIQPGAEQEVNPNNAQKFRICRISNFRKLQKSLQNH